MIDIMVIVIGVIVVGLAVGMVLMKRKYQEDIKDKRYPKGHYTGLGMAIGIPLGIPIGIAMGNIGIGPAIGVALGLAIGTAWEKKHAHELRPLTKNEIELKRKMMYFTIGFLLLGVIAFTAIFFLVK